MNLTMDQVKNTTMNQITAWIIIVFHFFTFSSSHAAVNILNAQKNTYKVIRKYMINKKFAIILFAQDSTSPTVLDCHAEVSDCPCLYTTAKTLFKDNTQRVKKEINT